MLSQAMADRQGSRDGVLATILSVDADLFASAPVLREEHFGPLAVLVRYGHPADLTRLLGLLPAGLTVTVHAAHADGPGPGGLTDTAVRRFLRPVTFQNAPESALPPALHDENPLRLRRLVDGVPD
jgi:NADP-dependent aldehyde dehydrogenase